MKILSPVSEFLKAGFKHITKDQDISASNAARSVNMKMLSKVNFMSRKSTGIEF
ncbi:hypothetical protein HDF26_001045 [Pedobacter cryoconitis]|uniref:hypothetical protein n=1 Tax=Pedobacter cryoconitis TaxID=188932 RepID=UPI0016097A87|nr:hypothetical protein [Pedobacter cryoconitis]MBB6270618.1 hypothetical protein [Pedobacter cryoconitis]